MDFHLLQKRGPGPLKLVRAGYISIVSILYQYRIDIIPKHIARPWRGGRTKERKGRREGIKEGKKEWKEGFKERNLVEVRHEEEREGRKGERRCK